MMKSHSPLNEALADMLGSRRADQDTCAAAHAVIARCIIHDLGEPHKGQELSVKKASALILASRDLDVCDTVDLHLRARSWLGGVGGVDPA
jgi:hypothetical protein